MSVTPSQFDLLSKLLDVANLRQRVIAQNVANVNTPGYRRLEVTFEEELARHLQQPGASADGVTPRVVPAPGGVERVDGNNVDIDAEMGRLTKNTLLMNAFTQILSSRVASLRSAISGR